MKNIPEDNKYFYFYNANPKGKDIGDCTYRAMSVFLNRSWADIAKMDSQYYISSGMWFYTDVLVDGKCRSLLGDYLKANGYECVYSSEGKGISSISSLRSFIDTVAEADKVYLCITSGHITVIKDMKVWDTWDSSGRFPEEIYVASV